MGQGSQHTILKIQGLDCVEEVSILKREIGPLVGGGQNLAFDVIKGEMTVLAGGVAVGVLVEAVRKTGMSARLLSAPVEARSWWSLNGRLTLTIVSGLLTLAGMTPASDEVSYHEIFDYSRNPPPTS